MYVLSNLDYVLLMLAAEKPVYGYQMEQIIKERGIRVWTNIGFSSIYHGLNKLENGGFLQSQNESDVDRPNRKIYSLTAAGKEILHEETLQRLASPRLHTGDFDLALCCLPILTKKEIRKSLEFLKETLAERIREVENKKACQELSSSPHVTLLFDHNLHAMKSEYEWVLSLIESQGG
ncbi:PadR family transcriptional regulator [Leptolinea tardivitalis]|uniref:Transcription regulator PadR N-terminal domain-containing protein n=1 Tax=Leptolinea tardivitalis TaxID=229920 RepID=A0A0P6WMC3_9CHLR|nr:PadR family transcriptional regulator [Leptolinea tardivitalis]KPL71012.1 hypothetical protein ADM99_11980 [Leptolinea tardivitalis]GAP22410.1 predicted transcriptional regulator [Leptolinea tardivitalis]